MGDEIAMPPLAKKPARVLAAFLYPPADLVNAVELKVSGARLQPKPPCSTVPMQPPAEPGNIAFSRNWVPPTSARHCRRELPPPRES